MAFDFSKLNFLSGLNARARVLVLAATVFGIIVLGYFGAKLIGGATEAVGPSRVASAPSGLQSVQGGDLTPEYQQALIQANTQIAQKAQITGGSAVPTVVNFNTAQTPSADSQCNIICSDQSANVKPDIDALVSEGKISPELGKTLQQLADKNTSVQDYAAELDRLVREGKLTAEQARLLLDKYKKQYQNRLLQQSAKMMDEMIKSGTLPLDVATELLTAQKMGATPADYAATLQDLGQQGKLSPATIQQLLGQYTQQRAKEIVAQSVASLRKMQRTGEITAEVAEELIDLENRMVAVDAYQAVLNRNLAAGKMTPIAAKKILDEFKMQKASIGPTGSISQLIQNAEAAAYGELNDLLKAGKISQAVASKLAGLIQQNIPFDDYQAVVNQMVQQNNLTPEIAKLKIADYQEVKGLREMAERLSALQGNNADNSAYADALKNYVQSGVLTPDQAAQLMQEYQAISSKAPTAISTLTGPGTEQFAALQQAVQKTATTQPVVTSGEFNVAQTEADQTAAQDQDARIQAMMTAMSGQAQQLVAAWQPTVMVHKEGAPPKPELQIKDKAAGAGTGADATKNAGTALNQVQNTVLIKAGTVIFGVLDTAVNSDYPDSPVMVTIVDGKYKGAKLLGKVTTTKGVSGQLDRVMLSFTLLNMDAWPTSKAVTAYAIDPDTARTVLASNVDYHYLKRFGAMMATSFLQGYGQAVMSSGGTSNPGAFGTSTTNPELSPSNKIAVAVGQMGTALGQATQNYANLPPTVKVDSGVGLGILFMADVT